ncbi:hypothetical protein [uncultured Maribacter sp.]|uniref:hypothetical protein n=1 Tax=uncultured Maribacter sp. TaxID=431308 RepID=UPI00260371CB|nr:hypothetical protein [uncultured Maribacter sp.]
MEKISFLICLLAFSFLSKAQSFKNVEDHQFAINIFTPGFIYEKGLSKNTTLATEFTIGFEAKGCTGCETLYGVYPAFVGQYRYYYNMERRLRKNKNISGNTGNYVSGSIWLQSGNPILGDLQKNYNITGVIAPIYGFQRTYKKGFNFKIEGGVGYSFNNHEKGVGVILHTTFGWVIRKKKK